MTPAYGKKAERIGLILGWTGVAVVAVAAILLRSTTPLLAGFPLMLVVGWMTVRAIQSRTGRAS